MHVADSKFTLSNDHLMQLSQSLLAFVALKFGPEFEVLIDKLQSLLVIFWKLNFFPELIG